MENRKCYMETRKNYIMVSSAKRFDNMLIVEVKIMKKKKNYLMKHIKVANSLAGLALVFSFLAANSRCYFIYHQPKMPEEMEQLRRY